MSDVAFRPRLSGTNQIARNNLTVTGTSQAVKLENTLSIRVANLDTSITAFLNFGTQGVLATSDDLPLPAGAIEIITVPPGCDYVAVIAASGSINVHITNGDGF